MKTFAHLSITYSDVSEDNGLRLPIRHPAPEIFFPVLLDTAEPLHHALRLTGFYFLHPQEVLDVICMLVDLQAQLHVAVKDKGSVAELDECHALKVGVGCGALRDRDAEVLRCNFAEEGVFVLKFNNQFILERYQSLLSRGRW